VLSKILIIWHTHSCDPLRSMNAIYRSAMDCTVAIGSGSVLRRKLFCMSSRI